MKRFIIAALLTTTTLATTPAAFGANAHNGCDDGRGRDCVQQDSRHDNRNDKHETKKEIKQEAKREAKQEARREAARKEARKEARLDRGHRPTAAQLKRLPKVPRGQEYRVIDNRIVRVDSDTLETIAVLGLLKSILN